MDGAGLRLCVGDLIKDGTCDHSQCGFGLFMPVRVLGRAAEGKVAWMIHTAVVVVVAFVDRHCPTLCYSWCSAASTLISTLVRHTDVFVWYIRFHFAQFWLQNLICLILMIDHLSSHLVWWLPKIIEQAPEMFIVLQVCPLTSYTTILLLLSARIAPHKLFIMAFESVSSCTTWAQTRRFLVRMFDVVKGNCTCMGICHDSLDDFIEGVSVRYSAHFSLVLSQNTANSIGDSIDLFYTHTWIRWRIFAQLW